MNAKLKPFEEQFLNRGWNLSVIPKHKGENMNKKTAASCHCTVGCKLDTTMIVSTLSIGLLDLAALQWLTEICLDYKPIDTSCICL